MLQQQQVPSPRGRRQQSQRVGLEHRRLRLVPNPVAVVPRHIVGQRVARCEGRGHLADDAGADYAGCSAERGRTVRGVQQRAARQRVVLGALRDSVWRCAAHNVEEISLDSPCLYDIISKLDNAYRVTRETHLPLRSATWVKLGVTWAA